jgi:hypothetical protein
MTLRKRLYFLIFIPGICVLSVLSQLNAEQIVKIAKVDNPPVIDGKLNDPAWQKASVFTDFKTLRPDFGLPPSEKTEVFMVYDMEKIYVGFLCYDSEPKKIKASISRRDAAFNDDWIAFCLDTFNDELGAYFFMVNPLGIQMDGTLNSDAAPDITLDMVWLSAGRLMEAGYSAEIAIPFKSLRFPSKQYVVMGFKVARTISRKSEEVDFPEYSPEKGSALAQFQKIELSGIKKDRILEILPATTVSKKYFQQQGSMTPLRADKDISLTSKFGITSDLVIDATYNPDFSHVETDAAQIDVNLRYALYYPEKRPFFMEGQERYAFGARLDHAPLSAVVHTRNVVDPLLGLKLNGKIGRNDIISAVYAQDEYPGNEAADKGDETLARRNAHFSILRYIRKLKNDSFLGGFYTGRTFAGTYNHIIGSDGRYRLSDKSYFEFHGFASFSKDQDSSDNYAGSAWGTIYVYSSRRFNAFAGLHDISRNFRTDVGYLRRRGFSFIPLYAGYSFYPSSKWLQRIEPFYWAQQGRDKYSGLYESFNILALRFVMPSQTYIIFSAWLANEVFEGKRFSRDAFRFEAGTQIRKQLFLECDIRRGKFIYYDPSNPYQGKGTRAYLSLLFQPASNISSGLDVSYSDFYSDEDGREIYDYAIFRNRTILQLNKYLFLRAVVEYNTYWKRINADFLASFTYIPGTVIYLGYGNVFERLKWVDSEYVPSENYLLTEKNFFFKASYLWRF